MEPYEILARLAEHGVPPEGEAALRMSVGLEDTLQRFKEETLSFVSGGGAELRFCYGPYGRGKTHLLKTLQATANSSGFATAYIDCRSENSPFSSLEETYRMIATSMRHPEAGSDIGIEALIRSCLENCSDVEALLGRIRSERKLELGFRNIVLSYIHSILEPGDPDFENDLRLLLNANVGYHFNMQSFYRKHSRSERPLGKLSKRNSNLWVRSLAALPCVLNYPGFVILFDETERSHHMSRLHTRSRHQHLVNIRNLVDHVAVGNFSGCVFCFAVVEDFIEIANSSLGALAQRIQRMHPGYRNPRAVWTSLDELTSPAPDDYEFYNRLGDRVLEIAVMAGLDDGERVSLKREFLEMGQTFTNDVSSGAVRQFVKSAAAKAAQLVDN
jgi:hypothetical protein